MHWSCRTKQGRLLGLAAPTLRMSSVLVVLVLPRPLFAASPVFALLPPVPVSEE